MIPNETLTYMKWEGWYPRLEGICRFFDSLKRGEIISILEKDGKIWQNHSLSIQILPKKGLVWVVLGMVSFIDVPLRTTPFKAQWLPLCKNITHIYLRGATQAATQRLRSLFLIHGFLKYTNMEK